MANTYQNIDLTQLFDNSVNQDAIKDVYTASKEIVDLIRQNYLNEGMSPQGKLANFNSVINYDGRLYQLQLMLPPEWKWVEYGRNPGPVSKEGIESLKEWISVKLGIPKGTKEMDSAAFLISRKIKRVGYYTPRGSKSKTIPIMGTARGKHVIEKSLNEADYLIEKLCNIIVQKIGESVSRDTVKLFDGLKSFTKTEIKS